MKLLMTLTILALTFATIQAQVFVNQDATGTNDGSSWADAYTDLQGALDNATAGDQIWVASGTYVPTGPTPDSSHFAVDQAVKIYGGFDGSESLLTDRDWVANLTTISGDKNGDDITGDFDTLRSDNAHHVFYINHNNGLCVIDGLIIQGGTTRLDAVDESAIYPEGYFPWLGGGMLILGQTIVRNCTLRDNDALGGSAMNAHSDGTHSDELIIENCIFESNNSSSGRIYGMNNPIIRNCTFQNNQASSYGAAMSIGNTNLTIEDCQFVNNQTLNWGGAVAVWQNQDIVLQQRIVNFTRCTFTNNSTSVFGGALALQNFVNNTELHLDSCTFTNNSTSASNGHGGAINLSNSDQNQIDPDILFTVSNTDFFDNYSRKGGAVYCFARKKSIMFDMSDCQLTGNTAVNFGGGLYFYGYLSGKINTHLERVRFESNIVTVGDGSGITILGGTTATLENVLFNGNTGSSTIYNRDTCLMRNVTIVDNEYGISQTSAGYSEFQNTVLDNQSSNFDGAAGSSVVSKGGNISSDGSLVSNLKGYGSYDDLHNVDPFLDANFVPIQGSPCVDAGNPEGISATLDLARVDRVQGNAIDIGAYESPFITFPTCTDQKSFVANPLTHQGAGSTSTTLGFVPDGDYPSFIISDIGQKLNGPSSNRYIDEVTVSYVNSGGTALVYGIYDGTGESSVTIEILDSVQSITVSLTNIYAGSNKAVSITLSAVTYCGTGTGCPDDDADGVCNVDDICPGGDDNIDTDGDGVPDYCDNCPNTANPNQADSDNNGTGDACEPSGCASPVTSNLNPNPLTHSGPGSSSTATLNLGGSNTDITFTISGINQKTNGNPSKRYIEEVVVDVDGQFFAQYSGSQVSSADVSIPGPAQLIEVTLYDSYDGDVQSGSMSIDFTAVSSCAASSAPLSDWSDEVQTFDDGDLDVRLFPNPTTGKAYVEFTSEPGQGYVTVRDILGRTITQKEVYGDKIVEIDLRQFAAQQMLFITVEIEGELLRTMKLIIVE